MASRKRERDSLRNYFILEIINKLQLVDYIFTKGTMHCFYKGKNISIEYGNGLRVIISGSKSIKCNTLTKVIKHLRGLREESFRSFEYHPSELVALLDIEEYKISNKNRTLTFYYKSRIIKVIVTQIYYIFIDGKRVARFYSFDSVVNYLKELK